MNMQARVPGVEETIASSSGRMRAQAVGFIVVAAK